MEEGGFLREQIVAEVEFKGWSLWWLQVMEGWIV